MPFEPKPESARKDPTEATNTSSSGGMKMSNLARTDSVFDRLFDFRRDFDNLFSGILTDSSQRGRRLESLVFSVPPIEAWVDPNDKKYHLSVALAGVNPQEIQLNLQGNTLTVSGEHKSGDEKKDANYLQREFSYEQFERIIQLPEAIDTQELTAQYNNGVLEIVAPIRAEALPKQIEIKNLPAASSNQGSNLQSATQGSITKAAAASS
jgi:HSP20 family protein